MKTYFTIDEYIELLATVMRNTLERDFGEKNHIVDLLTHTTTELEAIFYWMANYPQETK